MSSTAQSAKRAIAPPGLNLYTCQANNSNVDAASKNIAEVIDEETSDKKQNLEEIKKVAVNHDFAKLLESIKNAKLSSDDEQDDDYGAMDYESYPDYYWQMGYETDDGKYFEPSE